MGKKIVLSTPKLGFIVGTRVAAAVGIGLLASSKFSNSRRRQVGTFLLSLGALTTIPAAFFVFRSRGS
ncbi:MAG: hypothetical protein ABR582_11155 [Gemmatimonadaceae bacterium]